MMIKSIDFLHPKSVDKQSKYLIVEIRELEQPYNVDSFAFHSSFIPGLIDSGMDSDTPLNDWPAVFVLTSLKTIQHIFRSEPIMPGFLSEGLSNEILLYSGKTLKIYFQLEASTKYVPSFKDKITAKYSHVSRGLYLKSNLILDISLRMANFSELRKEVMIVESNCWTCSGGTSNDPIYKQNLEHSRKSIRSWHYLHKDLYPIDDSTDEESTDDSETGSQSGSCLEFRSSTIRPNLPLIRQEEGRRNLLFGILVSVIHSLFPRLEFDVIR